MTTPTYPDVHVQLSGEDGNAYSVVSRVRRALRRAGIPGSDCDAFSTQAFASTSYDDLLAFVMRTVTVS